MPVNISLDNSTLADGDVTMIREQLPPQHPVRLLLIDPSQVRKKLSDHQLDDLLTMIGAKDYIRLIYFIIALPKIFELSKTLHRSQKKKLLYPMDFFTLYLHLLIFQ